MSNRRKPKMPSLAMLAQWHERPTDGTWPQPRAGEAYVHQSGVALLGDHASLDYVRQETHDLLCNGLDQLRRSGVWWTHHKVTGEPGTLDARTAVDTVLPADDPDPRVVEVRAETLAALDEHPGAVYVVAWAIAAVPDGQVVYG